MKTVKLASGSVLTVTHESDAARVQRTVSQRHAIAMAYCREQGWPEDPSELTMEQILEIRRLPAWQEAGR